MDTVNEDFMKREAEICLYDSEEKIIHVLGGCTLDDRVGVWMILLLIEAGYRPHVCLTTGEEIGGDGAFTITDKYKEFPFVTNFFIELDRMNQRDSVYYTCGNREFKKYINSFGFKEARGTFTDCLILGEAYDIAAVNLSVGYFNEHTPNEYCNLNYTEETLKKVGQILEDQGQAFTYNIKQNNLIDFIKK